MAKDKCIDSENFRKTEVLLYNYMKFKKMIDDKKEQIKEIETCGTRKKSKSITSYVSSEFVDEKIKIEKQSDQITALVKSIHEIEAYLTRIDHALDSVKDDPYYEIIKMRYFDNETMENISYDLEKDKSTIARNKNRLIKEIQMILFAEDFLKSIFSNG